MRHAIAVLALTTLAWSADTRPKVRAITAFINVDPKSFSSQVEDTAKFLNAARDAYRKAGFEVETVRIVTQPFPRYIAGMKHDDALALLRTFDSLAGKLGFTPNVGPAMMSDSDEFSIDLLTEVLATTRINASIVTAADDGIHWRAVRQAAKLIKALSVASPRSRGNFNFATASMLKPYTPFYPAAWHNGPGRTFAVGLEGANVVADVFSRYHEPHEAEKQLTAALTKHLKDAEGTARSVAVSSGWTYAGIDPTPAPLGDVSIGAAIEAFTGAPFGGPGTMTAAAIITRAVQAVPIQRTGYAGLMVPVLEDNLLAKRWGERTYNRDSLLAYSAVCATGLDTVPLPGDITEDQIASILGDVASLAWKWQKPLAARLLPVPGKKAGDRTDFEDSRMANTVLQ